MPLARTFAVLIATLWVLTVGLAGLLAAQTTSLTPSASGTIRFFPDFSPPLLGLAPVGNAIQSTYFKTTATNREFRRGFFEFAIPACVTSATLTLTENRGVISAPVPPDTHSLSYYQDADLVITTADFDRPTTSITTFDTDANLVPQILSFDVSEVAAQSSAANLGFRVKLAVDPAFAGFGSLGSQFQVSLTVGCSPSDLLSDVSALAAAGNINAGQATALTSKLQAAQRAVDEGRGSAAIGLLQSFIRQLEALVKAGALSQAEGDALVAQAQAIIDELQN